MLGGNIEGVSLKEALQAAGGQRSILGIFKHVAAWSHVYHSYAFDEEPKHWVATSWPRGLRDTIEPTEDYLADVKGWFESSYRDWKSSLRGLPDEALDEQRPGHWGGTLPLFAIVVVTATHWTYHAGEINAILAIIRGEAWEYSEEVEENHISTAGHRVRPDWMSDDDVKRYEAAIAARDRELHPDTAR
jgi:hypothetical protein